MSSSNQFKVGDVVRLNSGGPLMTVTTLPDGNHRHSYYCKWFVDSDVREASFVGDALKKINAG